MTWEVRNLRYTEQGENIDCEVKMGEEWLPFTILVHGDTEMNEELYEQVKDSPDIAPYQPLPPEDISALDLQAINDALTAPGSMARALGLLTFQEINKLRVKVGLSAYTMDQFISALKANIR